MVVSARFWPFEPYLLAVSYSRIETSVYLIKRDNNDYHLF